MKTLFFALGLVLAFQATAIAEDKSDGCGLGWQVTKKQSFIATTTRATTNVIIPPTFGMTSGTMGCARHSFAKKDEPAAIYVLSNHEALTIEMAEGRGEFLAGLARSFGCGAGAEAEFGRMTQENFKDITSGATPVQMFHNIKQHLHSKPALVRACSA